MTGRRSVERTTAKRRASRKLDKNKTRRRNEKTMTEAKHRTHVGTGFNIRQPSGAAAGGRTACTASVAASVRLPCGCRAAAVRLLCGDGDGDGGCRPGRYGDCRLWRSVRVTDHSLQRSVLINYRGGLSEVDSARNICHPTIFLGRGKMVHIGPILRELQIILYYGHTYVCRESILNMGALH